ncbi:HNH endonuclease signature motif containing protein [Pseudonocardia alni]|uniref:HNH endonuclease signature motif containing protein n=1 Tax=Pseudonocardia alni TaxID=33907 RepID=UPI003326D94E
MGAAPHAIPAKKWTTVPDRVIERVRDHVAMGPNGCWISTYSVASHGYAQVGWQDSGSRWVTLCHRVVWIADHGDIEPGWTVDHICKTRRCIRPDHLRLLSNLDNARRTSGRDWPLGQCINGHSDQEFWVPGTKEGPKGYCSACIGMTRHYVPESGVCVRGHAVAEHWRPASEGRRTAYCAACTADAQRRYRAKKKDAMTGWHAAKRTGSGSKRPCRRINRGETT